MNLSHILTSDSLSLKDPKLPKLWFELSLFVEAYQDKQNTEHYIQTYKTSNPLLSLSCNK